MWSMVERLGIKPACCRRRLLLVAGSARVSRMRVKNFSGDGEEGDASVVAAGQLISFMLPKGKYNAPPPVIGQHLGDPHMVYDLCEPEGDVVTPGLQHLCCDGA